MAIEFIIGERTMDWIQVLWSVVVVFGLVAFVFFCRRKFRKWQERYIGCGWVLGYRGDSVTVDTLLLDSPAYKAGVRHYDVIHRYYGVELSTLTSDARLLLVSADNNAIGDVIEVEIERDGKRLPVFAIKAQKIQGPIPMYDSPTKVEVDDDSWRAEKGIGHCRRTGVWYATERLSEEALNRIFY